MKRRLSFLAIMSLLVSSLGCSTPLTTPEKGTVIGTSSEVKAVPVQWKRRGPSWARIRHQKMGKLQAQQP